MENHLTVSLFGTFSLCTETQTISEQDSSSKRLWTFLQYLTTFHQKKISQDELIEALWGDGECANPVNTLKTILHRARAMMESLGFSDGKQVIFYRRGFYTWNPEMQISTDVDRFDLLCKDLFTAPLDEEGLKNALDAIALYQGDFLPSAAGSPWALSLRTYYHTKYLKLCGMTSAYLSEQKQYELAVRICRSAISIDPYDEESHLLLMQCLAASGAQQAAIQHYTQVSALFMDQLGVTPSDEMFQLYRELSKSTESMEMDLHVIRRNLLEERPGGGAFFCEYAVFQDIYRLEARSAIRSGQVVQLAMLTLLDQKGQRLDSKRSAAAMDELRDVILSSLRIGDIFTRYSSAQYLILLPTASYENGVKILQRILNNYQRTLVSNATSVKYSLLPVLPALPSEEIPSGFVCAGSR